jgi:hypothetical protein
MSVRTRVEEYLAMRRSLGYKLRGEGRMLLEFADRLDSCGQSTVTVTAALAWATEPRHAAANHWHRRLSVVRCFARHLSAFDPTCETPRPTCSSAVRTGRPRITTQPPKSRRSCTRPARSRRPCRRPPPRH